MMTDSGTIFNGSTAARRLVERMRRSGREESSITTFLNYLSTICRQQNQTPDQIIEHVVTYSVDELQTWVEDLQNAWVAAKNTLKTRNLKLSVLKGFLIANHVANVRELELKIRVRVENEDHCPTDDEVKRILTACADNVERLIIWGLLESGVRVGTFNKLTWGHFADLDKDEDVIAVRISADMTKMRITYTALFGPNTQNCLRILRSELRNQRIEVKATDRVSTYEYHALLTKITRIIGDAGLRGTPNGVGSGKRYELRPHSLRKYLETKLENGGINHEHIQRLMGHGVSTYSKPQIEDLKAEYRRVMIPATDKTHEQMIVDYAKQLGVIDPKAYPTMCDAREYDPSLVPWLPKLREYFGVEITSRLDRNGYLWELSDTGMQKIDLLGMVRKNAE